MTLYCCKCGKQIPENAKFCPYCGEEVIFNRNNPEAVVIKPEDIKEPQVEEVKEEPKQEVKPEVVRDNSEEIAQYEREIETFSRRRKAMAIPGGIIFGIFLIATLVVTVLIYREYYGYIMDIINSYESGSDLPVQIPEMLFIYLTLLSVFSILSDVGLALLLVGLIPNSIKITKRKNKIEELKGYRK